MDEMKVTLSFSRGVLFALLNPESNLADTPEAIRLGLLNKKQELTTLGKLVAAASDQVWLRHKLILAERGPQEI
jgi:hypothetical protein